MTLTRAKLELLVKELLERTTPPCYQALKDAGGWRGGGGSGLAGCARGWGWW